MRTTFVMLTAALLLILSVALAQAPRTQPPAPDRQSPSPAPPTSAAQFTGDDGDEARYERYRDMRDGAYTNLDVSQHDRRVHVRRQRAAHRLPGSAVHCEYVTARSSNVRLQLRPDPAELQLHHAGRLYATQRQRADAGRQRAARGAGADVRHQRRHGRRRAVRAGRAPGGVQHTRAGRSREDQPLDLQRLAHHVRPAARSGTSRRSAGPTTPRTAFDIDAIFTSTGARAASSRGALVRLQQRRSNCRSRSMSAPTT